MNITYEDSQLSDGQMLVYASELNYPCESVTLD